MAKKKKSKNKALPPTFIGIDLAWSDRNPTGVAVIRDERLVAYSGTLVTDGEILRFVQEHLDAKNPAVVAIDAPLRVPNESGSRPCDRALSKAWRRFEAGALPANRRLLGRGGRGIALDAKQDEVILPKVEKRRKKAKKEQAEEEVGEIAVRGERLVAALVQRMRFTEAAVIPKRTQDRLVCEVFPHTTLVSLFDLDKTLKYKARRGRDYPSRWAELARYQSLLRSLRQGDPALKRTKDLLVRTQVEGLRGKAFKEYEDILDAVTCAYTASYLWQHGPRHAVTYGSLKKGSILVPLTSRMAKRLEEVRG